jgi:nitroreductase
MDALEAITTRRSTRKYGADVPEKELIEKVIEAGRYAPSGGNSQTTHFLVITDPDVLKELVWIVQTAFAKMEIQPDTYTSLKNSINASRRGNYVFHYNTPVLIVTANKKGYGNAMADSACALENMMIAANALNLGSCWINQLHWLDEDEAVREYLYGLGLAEDETVTGALSLGYAADDLPVRTALPRTGNPVTWISD